MSLLKEIIVGVWTEVFGLFKALIYFIFHPIDFFRKWYEGYKKLTPIDYARAMVGGYLWGTLGLFSAGFFLLWTQNYIFVTFVFAMSWLQLWNHRKFKKQLEGFEKMQEEMGGVCR